MIITSAPATARVSGSVTVPSMAATPDPDCAAAVPAATNSINSAEASARGITRERHREINAESKYFWVVTTVLLIDRSLPCRREIEHNHFPKLHRHPVERRWLVPPAPGLRQCETVVDGIDGHLHRCRRDRAGLVDDDLDDSGAHREHVGQGPPRFPHDDWRQDARVLDAVNPVRQRLGCRLPPDRRHRRWQCCGTLPC